MSTKKIENENILAVEGKDEENFFTALLEHLKVNGVQIICVGGKDNFKNELALYLQSEHALDKIKIIGFVRDAEAGKAQDAFQSICGIIQKYSLPCPEQPNKPKVQGGKKTSIYIMPNNNESGMLETLCLRSIQDLEIYQCIDSFVSCYKNKISIDKYNEEKARMLAYLSTRTPIVNSLGIAAIKNMLDFDNPCFDEIKGFLIGLYQDGEDIKNGR